MKKLFTVLFASFAFLFLFSRIASAYGPGCTANNNTTDPAAWNSVNNKPIGFVPCGISAVYAWGCIVNGHNNGITYGNSPGSPVITASSDAAARTQATNQCQSIFAGSTVIGQVAIQQSVACPCELGHIFIMALRIYNFLIWIIALPLAGLLIVIGGILILLGGINGNWHNTGKTILKGAGIALLFIFGSWLIIDIVFKALGHIGSWNIFPI